MLIVIKPVSTSSCAMLSVVYISTMDTEDVGESAKDLPT